MFIGVATSSRRRANPCVAQPERSAVRQCVSKARPDDPLVEPVRIVLKADVRIEPPPKTIKLRGQSVQAALAESHEPGPRIGDDFRMGQARGEKQERHEDRAS